MDIIDVKKIDFSGKFLEIFTEISLFKNRMPVVLLCLERTAVIGTVSAINTRGFYFLRYEVLNSLFCALFLMQNKN